MQVDKPLPAQMQSKLQALNGSGFSLAPWKPSTSVSKLPNSLIFFWGQSASMLVDAPSFAVGLLAKLRRYATSLHRSLSSPALSVPLALSLCFCLRRSLSLSLSLPLSLSNSSDGTPVSRCASPENRQMKCETNVAQQIADMVGLCLHLDD